MRGRIAEVAVLASCQRIWPQLVPPHLFVRPRVLQQLLSMRHLLWSSCSSILSSCNGPVAICLGEDENKNALGRGTTKGWPGGMGLSISNEQTIRGRWNLQAQGQRRKSRLIREFLQSNIDPRNRSPAAESNTIN